MAKSASWTIKDAYKHTKKLHLRNMVAISIVQISVLCDRTRHVEIDWHFIKADRPICMPFVSIVQQVADILSKELFLVNLERIISKLGVIDIQLEGGVEVCYKWIIS